MIFFHSIAVRRLHSFVFSGLDFREVKLEFCNVAHIRQTFLLTAQASLYYEDSRSSLSLFGVFPRMLPVNRSLGPDLFPYNQDGSLMLKMEQ